MRIHFIPPEWRKLSHAQEVLLKRCIREGPEIVTKKTKRTARVLFRGGLLEKTEEYKFDALQVEQPREGQVIRASGKAWEIYRDLQQRQGFADDYIEAMRGKA